MKSLHADYCSGDKAVAKFLTIYLDEAHAEDEWRLPESEVEVKDGVSVKVHRSIQERLDAAKLLVKNRQLNALELVCDSMQGDVTSNYDAWPERLYIILDGVVVYKVRSTLTLWFVLMRTHCGQP